MDDSRGRKDESSAFEMRFHIRRKTDEMPSVDARAANGDASRDELRTSVRGLENHPPADIQLRPRMRHQDGIDARYGSRTFERHHLISLDASNRS